MCRTVFESKSGSYAGRIAPPGMPKTTSAPTLSNDRTSDCAPVTGSDISVLPHGLGQQKTPRAEHGGVSAFAEAADALANYDQVTHSARVREPPAGVKPVGWLSHMLVRRHAMPPPSKAGCAVARIR